MFGDRLLPCAGLCLRDEDDTTLEMDYSSRRIDRISILTHRGFDADDDERVNLRVPSCLRALDESRHLIDRQVGDPALPLVSG